MNEDRHEENNCEADTIAQETINERYGEAALYVGIPKSHFANVKYDNTPKIKIERTPSRMLSGTPTGSILKLKYRNSSSINLDENNSISPHDGFPDINQIDFEEGKKDRRDSFGVPIDPEVKSHKIVILEEPEVKEVESFKQHNLENTYNEFRRGFCEEVCGCNCSQY